MDEQKNDNKQSEEREPTFEESFQMLYSAAPKPIQKFLQKKQYEAVSASLARSYGLSVEQTGILSQGLIYLLLGAQSPQEFSEFLKKEIGLTDEMSVQITNNINETVFLPLQTQIQQDENTSPQTAHDTHAQQTDSLSKESPDTSPPSPPLSPLPSPTPPPPTPPAPATPPSEKEQSTTYTPLPRPSQPIPPSPETPSSSPLVKEYSVDPYREAPE